MNRKRGIVYVEATILLFLFLKIEVEGYYDFSILEETDTLYRVRFDDRLLRTSLFTPQWLEKKRCTLIEEGRNERNARG